MPPRASRRLAILLLPEDEHAAGGVAARAFAALNNASIAHRVVRGGNGPVIAEEREAVTFLANRQGGFVVRCPENDGLVTGFARALETWRSGGVGTVACDCGATHDLRGLQFAPPAGFARSWLRVEDAASAEIDPDALNVVASAFGGVRIVLRRG